MAAPGFGLGASELLIMMLFFGGSFGLPMGIPPDKEDVFLHQIAPEECLFYTSWAAMAEADPKSGNATEKMFADPEIKKLLMGLEKLVQASVAQVEQHEGAEAGQAARDAWKWTRLALSRPSAIFLESFAMGARPRPKGAIVINVGPEAGALRDALDKYEKILFRNPVGKIEDVTIDIGSFRRAKLHPDAPHITWGVVRNYFIVGIGDGAVEGIMERAKQKSVPTWLSEIQTKLPIERRATVTFVNVAGIKQLAGPGLGLQGQKVLVDLGLDNVQSMISVTGLDDKAFLSRSLIALDGPPKGVLSFLSGKPLTAADLQVIPADSTFAAVARFDVNKSIDIFLDVVGSMDPRSKQAFQSGMSLLDDELGVKIRGDLLASLGDVWRVYTSPSDGGWIFPGITVVVDAREPERLQAAMRKLARLAADEGGVALRTSRFGDTDLHILQSRESFGPAIMFSPTWAIHDGKLILGLSPNPVKGYLGRTDDFRSLADVPEVAQALAAGKGGTIVGYQDTRELIRIFYPLLPLVASGMSSQAQGAGIDFDVALLPSAQALTRHVRPGVSVVTTTPAGIEFTARQTLPSFNPGAVVPIGAGLAIPAIGAARDAAQRNMATNQLKQIVLAAHNYADANRGFPPAFTAKDGKPLLSWRVHLLPYLEENALYQEFHLDEPWDSEHNKKLVNRMPRIYANANLTLEQGKTAFAGVRRPDAIFAGEKGIQFQEITDGTSNTVMVIEIEPANAVVWSKPDDFTPDDKAPAKGLHFRAGGVCLAAFADGHVSALSNRLRPEAWKALFTRNGGEVVSENDFGPQPVRDEILPGIPALPLDQPRPQRPAEKKAPTPELERRPDSNRN